MVKFIALFIAFVDILGFAIFIPVLGEIAEYFHIPYSFTGFILSVYAFFSFLFAPILGQLSDKFGRKKVLQFSIFGTFIGNLLLYIAPNFWVFLLGRIIDGITGGNISIIQSIFSDLSKNDKERIKFFGYIGALFGIGFIIGPLIGGFLLKFGLKIIFLFLVLLSLIEIILSFFLRETNKNFSKDKLNYNTFGKIIQYLKNKDINYFLYSFFLVIFSINMYQLMISVILKKEYNISGEISGYIFALAGLIGTINQVVFLKNFWLRFFDIKKLLIISNVGLFITLFLMGLFNNLYIFLLFFLLNVIFMGVFRPVFTNNIIVKVKKTGEILGIISSLRSLVLIFSPVLSGILIQYNINIFYLSSFLVLISLFLIWLNYNDLKK